MTCSRVFLAVLVLASGMQALADGPYSSTAPIAAVPGEQMPLVSEPLRATSGEPEPIEPGPVLVGDTPIATPDFDRAAEERFDTISVPYRTTVAASGLSSLGVPLARSRAWYLRLDAFHWSEEIESEDLVDESGTLITLGFSRRTVHTRFRAEIFGGVMDYDGYAQDGYHLTPYDQMDGTGYLGLRGELEYLFEPGRWGHTRMVFGLGTRMWQRDLRDGVLPWGEVVAGYQETWYTLYPYVGIESKESPEPGGHFFYSLRLGFVPLTREKLSFGPTLQPEDGTTGQFEFGVRGQKFLCAVLLEIASWNESDVVNDYFQPSSAMATAGLRFAYSF